MRWVGICLVLHSFLGVAKGPATTKDVLAPIGSLHELQGHHRFARSFNRKDDVPTRPNAVVDIIQHQPYFDNTTDKNVTTQLSKTAFLNCRVKNLGDKTVSWIRLRDLHLLTVGRYTYTSDQRFQALHADHSDDWTLQIKYPTKRDAGYYECQVNTEPKISMFVNLNVVDYFVEPRGSKPNKGRKNRRPGKADGESRMQRPRRTDVSAAKILGSPEMYVKSGSTLTMTCVVTQSYQPQTFVFWYHNGNVINFDSPRGGISLVTTNLDKTTSILQITNVRQSDSGNYSCMPSNADSASIVVHVLNGEKPGALQHGERTSAGVSFLFNYLCICITVLSVILWFQWYLRLGHFRINCVKTAWRLWNNYLNTVHIESSPSVCVCAFNCTCRNVADGCAQCCSSLIMEAILQARRTDPFDLKYEQCHDGLIPQSWTICATCLDNFRGTTLQCREANARECCIFISIWFQVSLVNLWLAELLAPSTKFNQMWRDNNTNLSKLYKFLQSTFTAGNYLPD